MSSVPSAALPVDAPSTGEGHRVVIVGGGWSGVAVAVQLLRRGGADLRVTLVEQGTDLGRGVAYGAAGNEPTLNVPAGRMGIDPAVPDDFLAYARARGVAAEATSLLSRRLYGDYVLDRLAGAEAASRATLRLERGRVAHVRRGDAGWDIVLADGRHLPAEHVVLASGHGPANVPPGVRAVGAPILLGTDVLARPELVAPGERVVLVGTGLTALDVVGSLKARGHTTPVHVVSHTGAWPHAHLPTLTWSGEPVRVDGAALPSAPEALAAWFDAAVQDAKARGVPWQAVVDALRPHIASVWQRMSAEERTRFLRDHRPTWERLRHRAPAAQIDAARALEAAGEVVRLRGTVLGGHPNGTAWRLVLGTAEAPVEVVVDQVIVCTGPSSDVRGFDGPWPGLLASGHAQSDVHGLGVLAGPRGEVLATDGTSHGLWALGGLLRPRDFESTAVPELARQAATLGVAITEAVAGK